MTKYTFRRYLREVLNPQRYSQCYIFRAIAEAIGFSVAGIALGREIAKYFGTAIGVVIAFGATCFGFLRYGYWWWRDIHERKVIP